MMNAEMAPDPTYEFDENFGEINSPPADARPI